MNLTEEITQTAIFKLTRSSNRIIRCFDFLEEEDIWQDVNAQLVSPGNLVLHLIGNITQHILSGLGRASYTRRRDQEFVDKPNLPKAQLLQMFTTTIDQAIQVIQNLQAEDLVRLYRIQGHEYSGVSDIITVVEHLSYHVGQIAFAVKVLKHVDLGLTAGQDLNQQNQPTRELP